MAYGYFIQGCPTCGRKVQIRLDYLGKYVTCHHCGAAFLAFGENRPEKGDGNRPVPGHTIALKKTWQSEHMAVWPFGPEET
ncbi:MAG: hypothetical protein WBH86_14970 [Thermogutta sp.]|nr:hypothetical protein [Thermogutta sp.]HOP77806.1 hypothetical protein [Thermogutta sp.]HPU06218.1 hypothetical protein [Thermogutta sp.]HQF13669.1 hypothetical protein [Thermogutta sp.]